MGFGAQNCMFFLNISDFQILLPLANQAAFEATSTTGAGLKTGTRVASRTCSFSMAFQQYGCCCCTMRHGSYTIALPMHVPKSSRISLCAAAGGSGGGEEGSRQPGAGEWGGRGGEKREDAPLSPVSVTSSKILLSAFYCILFESNE